MIVIDESLVSVFESFRSARDFEHVIVVTRSGEVPDGMLDYEALLDDAEPAVWPEIPTRAGPRPCVTRRARRAARRASSTRTGRWSCTRSPRRCRTRSASPSRDTILPVVPMFHANAWGLAYAAAFAGAALVLPGPRLDPESVLDLLADERVTLTAGVPTVWMAMLQALNAEPDRWDLSALRAPDRRRIGGPRRACSRGSTRTG